MEGCNRCKMRLKPVGVPLDAPLPLARSPKRKIDKQSDIAASLGQSGASTLQRERVRYFHFEARSTIPEMRVLNASTDTCAVASI
jgi:hypothetical protein